MMLLYSLGEITSRKYKWFGSKRWGSHATVTQSWNFSKHLQEQANSQTGISTLHVGALLNTGLVKYFCHIKLSDSDVVRKHGVADKPGRGNFVPGKLGQQSVK